MQSCSSPLSQPLTHPPPPPPQSAKNNDTKNHLFLKRAKSAFRCQSHAHTHTCTHTYAHTHIHLHTHTHAHTHTHTCTHTCTCARAHTPMRAHTKHTHARTPHTRYIPGFHHLKQPCKSYHGELAQKQTSLHHRECSTNTETESAMLPSG